jgi:hypothetical protein
MPYFIEKNQKSPSGHFCIDRSKSSVKGLRNKNSKIFTLAQNRYHFTVYGEEATISVIFIIFH